MISNVCFGFGSSGEVFLEEFDFFIVLGLESGSKLYKI